MSVLLVPVKSRRFRMGTFLTEKWIIFCVGLYLYYECKLTLLDLRSCEPKFGLLKRVAELFPFPSFPPFRSLPFEFVASNVAKLLPELSKKENVGTFRLWLVS